jgi:hypothetical protein
MSLFWEEGAARLVFADDVQGVDDSGDVAEDGQQDVEEQARVAAELEEDAERGKHDGEEHLADVASGESHFDGVVWFVGEKGCWCLFLDVRRKSSSGLKLLVGDQAEGEGQ